MRNYQQKIKSNIFIMAVFAIMLLGGGQLFGQTIRIASMAPQDSPWGRTLNRIAAEWHEISGGRITLQIYHGGVAGNEADVLRKIKINQLQGGVLTSSGMNSVTNKMLALSIPMQMRSKEEFLYVFDHVRPQLEASLREERLHVAGWTFGGWVYFFSRDPIESPESLRGSKLSVTPTEPDMQRAFQLMGYSPVPISTNEILTALNSGMVDSFFTSPLAAASFQFFAIANNMLNIPVAPFLGSVVISTRVWDRIPDSVKPKLEEAARIAVQEMEVEVLALEKEAIDTMVSYGLNVITPDEQGTSVWREEFANATELAVGRVFDEDMYTQIKSLLAEYRNE